MKINTPQKFLRIRYTVYVVYRLCGIPFMWYIWWWLQFGSLANHVNIAKLNACHLGCKHGFLSIQYSKTPIKNLTICILRANQQM